MNAVRHERKHLYAFSPQTKNQRNAPKGKSNGETQ
ncbi:Uncharacterised protein [Vibrio cholerae]|nr:Uncharacterised protein [Vibrio cholerae]